MANITNHYAPGSCVFQAGSSQNGDVYITGGTFYQGEPKEKKEEDTEEEKGKVARSINLKPLFPKIDNAKEENEMVRRRERDRFLQYLSLHKMGNRPLTTQQDDTLNSIVAGFLIVWRNNGWIAKSFSGKAVHRFLHDDCGIRSEVEPSSYANKITQWVKEKKYSIDVLAEVEEYMKPRT